ncbi:MAG: SDR family oxidoreductase [Clostridiales bacterium]|nr:SDR family oxidoreductase [Clostridiales bacterium]
MGYVLITGASSGIGYELAKEYARHGNSLIITATNQSRLDLVKQELEDKYPVQVIAVAEDLSQKGAATQFYRKIKERNLTVSELINNAGFGCVGEFVDIPLSFEESMMMVNMVNLVGLTKLFLSDMKDAGSGKILNVASTGAFQPGPWIASYYATKSFVFNFSEAIRMEYKKYGIQISTLCPGATKTNFTKRAGKSQMKHAMEAEKVAKIAYNQFHRNKNVIIPGIWNRLGQIPPRKIRSLFIEVLQKKLAGN